MKQMPHIKYPVWYKVPGYSRWYGLFRRCYDKKDKKYHLYGARGIGVCERWHNFENFIDDMGQLPSPNHTIDRIDGNLGYEPGNCRWATSKEQCNNKRAEFHHLITVNGVTKNQSEWAKELGLSPGTLWFRLQAGWSPERAVTQPVRKRNDNWKAAAAIRKLKE